MLIHKISKFTCSVPMPGHHQYCRVLNFTLSSLYIKFLLNQLVQECGFFFLTSHFFSCLFTCERLVWLTVLCPSSYIGCKQKHLPIQAHTHTNQEKLYFTFHMYTPTPSNMHVYNPFGSILKTQVSIFTESSLNSKADTQGNF